MGKYTKKYTEAELIRAFGLKRFVGGANHNDNHIIQWLQTPNAVLDNIELAIFDGILEKARQDIMGWNEEALKMKFISFVLHLAHLQDTNNFKTYFEKTIQAEIDGQMLKTKTDFMVATGIMDMPEVPYFHFQEYKRQTDPNGEPMAQLLQAMLIAQALNGNTNAIYGCTIIGKYWEFVLFDQRTYYVSESYDCTKRNDLLQIIAILRKFRHILETKLLRN
jgi:hypothetical protein